MHIRILLVLGVCCAVVGRLPAQPPAMPPSKSGEMTSITEIGGKTLKEWISETKHSDAGERIKAVRTIVFFGPNAADQAGPALIDRLGDKDSSVRTNAVIAIGLIGVGKNDIPHAVDALAMRVAEDKQAIVRYHAAFALARFGPQPRAVAKLLTAIQDGSSCEIRKAALYAVGIAAYDPKGADMRTVELVAKAMDDSTAEVRMEAVVAIISLGKPAAAADLARLDTYLRQRLKSEEKLGDKRPSQKMVVVWLHMALMKMNGFQDADLKAVAKFLKDKDASVREQAASAFSMLGKEARPEIPALIDALQDKVPDVVLAAAAALVNTGSRSDRIMAALDEVRTRKDAPEGLKKAMDKLIDDMKDKTEK